VSDPCFIERFHSIPQRDFLVVEDVVVRQRTDIDARAFEGRNCPLGIGSEVKRTVRALPLSAARREHALEVYHQPVQFVKAPEDVPQTALTERLR